MRVVAVPCLSDNYAYLLVPDGSRDAIVVDPSEAAPVRDALRREGLKLVGIFDTHHHWDHVGGNEELAREAKVPVWAHSSDVGRVPGQTEAVDEGRPLHVAGLEITPYHIPGHTTGAVAYHVEGCVFTGDTLFVAGCGRLFEGTPAMMYESLSGKLAKLPPETRVYCGHEYTVNNLRFAETIEPDNAAIRSKLAAARAARDRNEPTVPSTIGEELATNPFMRCHQPSVRARYPGATPVEVLAKVRAAKDSFK